MNGTEFKPGDIVQLKSSGPKMTVDRYGTFPGNGARTIEGFNCVWFEGSEVKSHVFPAEVLEKF